MNSPHADADQLDCQQVADMLSAYALDILEPAEAAAVARHLATCANCREQLAREEMVVAHLGMATPAASPPPALRSKLLAEISEAPAAERLAVVPPLPIPLRSRSSGIYLSRMAAAGLALVASLLVLGLVVGGVVLYQTREARDAAQQGQAELAEYLRHGGTVVALSAVGNNAAAGNGSLVIEQSGQDGMIVVGNMTSLASDQALNVWAARGSDRWVVGELSVNANGAGWMVIECPQPLNTYDTVGVTLVDSNGAKHDLLMASVPRKQQ